MIVELDYSEKRNICHLSISDDDVRNRLMYAFSVPNEAKKFAKGPSKRFIPDRVHFISPSGMFNFRINRFDFKMV